MRIPTSGSGDMLRGFVVFLSCVAIIEASQEGSLLRRTTKEAEGVQNNAVAGTGLRGDSTSQTSMKEMEDVWEKAAAEAQREYDLERLLAGGMSMPTTAPVPSPTPVPTGGSPVDCLQGRTRAEYILDLLEEVTDSSLLEDSDTPQGMAYAYMATDDPNLDDPCSSDTIEQRYALITLYYSMGGDDWTTTQGWLGQDQECTWYGIDCTGDDDEIVTRLELSSNNLVGSLTDEVKVLTSLQRLDLYTNSVTGTLPTGLAELSSLVLLDLEQNLLTGEALPSQILALGELLAYRVSDNFLSGSISTQVGNLNQLQQLWLATNQLTGTIPTQLGSLSEMQSLFLHENTLVGTLPTEMGNLVDLEDFRIYYNSLQDTIPTELFQATSLESLRLEYNFFSGTIPSELGMLTVLSDFRIDTNALTGSLPSEIGNLVSLETFIIHSNFLSGELPNVFSDLTSLDYVDAANNQLSGTIPDSIFDGSALRLLYLSNNTFTGTIPDGYSQPSLLRDLYLDGNGLTGTVPAIASGQLTNLNEFLLHYNFLSGTMPDSICDLRSSSSGDLDDLFSDCGGESPEIDCDYPGCCNRCFEGGEVQSRTRRTR